jgi:hypothetical protein
LLTYTVNQKEYTFAGKGDLERQIPILKKKFSSYHDFAGKTVSELFGDALNNAWPLSVNSFTSGVFYNKGNGNFEFKAFPSPAQTSPLFGFAIIDVPGKGVIAGGNFSGVLPFEGRYDADYGDVLLLDKNKNFQWQSPVSSGFLLKGEVRDIKTIKTAKGIIYAVAFNNGEIRFFELVK